MSIACLLIFGVATISPPDRTVVLQTSASLYLGLGIFVRKKKTSGGLLDVSVRTNSGGYCLGNIRDLSAQSLTRRVFGGLQQSPRGVNYVSVEYP